MTKENNSTKPTCYDCRQYHSIPQETGPTDYCNDKSDFIEPSEIEKKCWRFEYRGTD